MTHARPIATVSPPIVPTWSPSAPAIDAGSEPWPGGTVDSTDATALRATSSSADWTIDDVSRATPGDSITLSAGDTSGTLARIQTASNAAGSSSTSASVALQRVQGVTRADRAHDTALASVTIPATGSIALRWVGIGWDASQATILEWAVDNTSRIALVINSVTNLTCRNCGGGPVAVVSMTGAWNGSTEHRAVVTWAAGTVSAYYTSARGSVVTDTASTGSLDPSGAGQVGVMVSPPSAPAGSDGDCAASIEAIALSRVLSSGERTAFLVTDDEPLAALVGDASESWHLRPVPSTEVDGGAVAAGSQLAGATWTLDAGTARMTQGGLNAAT